MGAKDLYPLSNTGLVVY